MKSTTKHVCVVESSLIVNAKNNKNLRNAYQIHRMWHNNKVFMLTKRGTFMCSIIVHCNLNTSLEINKTELDEPRRCRGRGV